MNHTEILKKTMQPAEYRRIPQALRIRPEDDLFAPLIWNLYISTLRSCQYSDYQIANACRIPDPHDPTPDKIIKPGDRVKIFEVFGSLSQPYDHVTVSEKRTVEKVFGPYTQDGTHTTPPHWSITFTRNKGVLHDIVSWHGIICVMWKTNICWIEKMPPKLER